MGWIDPAVLESMIVSKVLFVTIVRQNARSGHSLCTLPRSLDMKKTSMISALIAASTVFGGSLANGQERPLLKHHERFKQRLNPPQTQRSVPAPMPYYENTPGTVQGYAEQPAPPSAMSQAQPPAPIVSPGDAGSTPSGQPSAQTPTFDSSSNSTPGGRLTSNNGLDLRGLAADTRTSSPLSGPLNTIGDFFAPACQQVVVQQPSFFGQAFTSSVGLVQTSGPNQGQSGFSTPQLLVGPNGSAYGFVVNPSNLAGVSIPATQYMSNLGSGTILPLPQSFDLDSGDASHQAALQQGILALEGGAGVVVLQGGLATLNTNNQQGTTYFVDQNYQFTPLITPDPTTVLICSAPGSQLGRYKLGEQNSPLPRDRFFFDYSFFHNAVVSTSPSQVHRYAPGFEKTFYDKLCSVEVRVPMGFTVNSTQTDGAFDASNAEFGNLAFAFKGLLIDRGDFLLTAGLGVQTPTADDIILKSDGTEIYRLQNKQVRLLPYLATLHTRGDWMWQNWVQVDVAANGNDVFFNRQRAGSLQEQNFLYLDSSISKWMYRDFNKGTGWALTGEVHYNRTIGNADFVQMGNSFAGTPGFEADIVNLTFGSTYAYGKTTFTTAYGTPITQDRGFDGEFRLLVNRFF